MRDYTLSEVKEMCASYGNGCGDCKARNPEGDDCLLEGSPMDWPVNATERNQDAKADSGKLPLTLVPTEMIRAVAAIRRYGVNKYSEPDNWKRVELERYRDAAFRHFLAYLDDPTGVDEESGLPHLWHLACNIAFLCELEPIEKAK